MKNLYDETNTALERLNKTEDDIDFIEVFFIEQHGEKYTEISTMQDMKPITYDDGFGGQMVYGHIVFKDGTWIEREEYDGAESGEYEQKPKKGELISYLIENYVIYV